MYQERTLESFLSKATKQFSVMLIVGPRQVGKTTILQHLSKGKMGYVTLDDPKLAALAREEPSLFLQRFKYPLLIDEIQYAPELLPHIKMLVDKEGKSGMFWLTGSQQFHVMNGVSESLAGRVGIVNLLGLSLKELFKKPIIASPFVPTLESLQMRLDNSNHLELQQLYNVIWRGSYPAMWINNKEDDKESRYGDSRIEPKTSGIDRDLFYGSYVQTYLQRDVRDLANVGDEGAFLKFLRVVAARTGQLLNISDMARDTNISVPTAKRWLSILEASGIVYMLEPYFLNETTRLIKAPKIYFIDTGLCAYLTDWSSPATLEAGAMSGAILETFIVIEILKSYWHSGKRAPIYYYRDKDKKEIDLVISQDGKLYPMEIKKTAFPDKNSFKQFKLLAQFGKPIGEGGVICLADTLIPLDTNINAIPVYLL